MSSATRCADDVAIRGGVPVIFPQFGSLGPLRKHGLVRAVPWDVIRAGGASHDATSADATPASFIVETAVGPTDAWPNEAHLMLTATAAGSRLRIRLDVDNTGPAPMRFTAALHTYLAVQVPGSSVTGLEGLVATDAMAGGGQTTLSGALPTDSAMDLMARDVGARPLTVSGPSGPMVTMTAHGFTDRVVWNPGSGHGLSDVPPGEEARFVCVEPAALSEVRLAPVDRWSGVMDLLWRQSANPEA
jgi:glucose-6-phosphate 1-epimerase